MRRAEEGFAIIWVSACLLFLMGAAALAVDVSGFYVTARVDQTVADLSCLAGIPEMPESPATARAAAVANARSNFPALATVTPATSGNITTLDDGNGNFVTIEAPYGGDANKMHVHVQKTDSATFGRVIGGGDTPIVQEAYCKVYAGNGGNVPFGALPGGWTGGLQAENPCGTNSGNCGRLFVPRADTSGNNPTTIKNIAEGLDRILDPALGTLVNCSSVGAGGHCNVVDTNTGVNAAALGDGFKQRLDDPSPAAATFTMSGIDYDADSMAAILGGSPSPLTSKPAGWQDWIHGEWGTADVSNHFYWNDVVAKCDSPRLLSFPIVSSDPDWSQTRYDNGDPFPEWPNGNKQMKVIGIFQGILADPNSAGDFNGGTNLKKASSHIIWFGPDARCVGPNGSTTPYTPGSLKTWRLVDPGG